MEIKLINGFSVIIISWCTYLGVDHQALYLYGILMFIDYITGIIKGFLQKDLKSKTAIYGLVSKCLILLVIFAIGISGKILNFDLKSIMSALISAFTLAELYSIIGNIYEIRSGKKVPEYDALSFIFSMILKKITQILENIDKNKLGKK